jgi:hypothetical protein
VQLHTGDLISALQSFNRAARCNPPLTDAFVLQDRVLFKLAVETIARADVGQGTALHPGNHSLTRQRGLLH